MERRHFLRLLTGIGVAGVLPMTLVRPALGATPSRFVITVSASGGWDPTALVDPKGNALRADGLGPVNNYPVSLIKTAGKLRYAGYPDGVTPPATDSPGHLDTFFAKHYSAIASDQRRGHPDQRPRDRAALRVERASGGRLSESGRPGGCALCQSAHGLHFQWWL
jgi:hypothetical protein